MITSFFLAAVFSGLAAVPGLFLAPTPDDVAGAVLAAAACAADSFLTNSFD